MISKPGTDMRCTLSSKGYQRCQTCGQIDRTHLVPQSGPVPFGVFCDAHCPVCTAAAKARANELSNS
jgi:hypothetical protein